MKTENSTSAGLAFIQHGHAAIPRTLGDREAIAILSKAMSLAIQGRFAFKTGDAAELKRLGMRRCVGVFDPLHESYYYQACLEGGTYARMWESHNDVKPWLAWIACFPQLHGGAPEFLGDNRVTKGVWVLLPADSSPEEEELASYDGLQVWRVTDLKNDEINLCRYKPCPGRYGVFRHPGGAPARRRTLTREMWETYQEQLRAVPPLKQAA